MGIEEPLDPAQPIIDAHHHLYERPGIRYLAEEFEADLASGHDVRATVLVQARSAYRTEGPIAYRPLGETEFAMGVGSKGDRYGIAAGIVAHADLTLGASVRRLLERHCEIAGGITRGGGRLAGIRHITAWDPDPGQVNPAYPTSEDLMDQPGFRAGFAQLAPLGLAFDAWVYFHQLPRLARLARAFPETTIVVDHCGGLLGTGGYAGRAAEVFDAWSSAMNDLAQLPNVRIKLGGLGMPLTGLGFDRAGPRPSSQQLAQAWKRVMLTCLETFGAGRCMAESNFPPDRVSYDYGTGWNAMKRIVQGASKAERDAVFWRTAATTYGLALPPHP